MTADTPDAGEEGGTRTVSSSAPQPRDPRPFGPGFFLGQLRAFAREHCPSPSEQLPAVTVHLATGEELDLCHVAGLAPTFVALAIRERIASSGAIVMRTELVPYGLIARITIRPVSDEGKQVGFNADAVPRVVTEAVTPTEALRAAAGEPSCHG